MTPFSGPEKCWPRFFSLIFLSLVFCFSLVFSETKEIPWRFECFQLFFLVFLRFVWGSEGVKNPWCLHWFFLGFYLNTKERKIRVHGITTRHRVFIRSWCWDPDFRDMHLRKLSETFRLPAEKPKSAVDTQKTKKNRCLGIRSWDPNLSGGYQNCGLGIYLCEIFQNRSGKSSEIFSKV